MSATVIVNPVAVGGKNQITASWSYSDPYQFGDPLLRHRFFQLETSTSPDLSAAGINQTFDTFWTSTVASSVTLYHRVRSFNEYGRPGAWSEIFSGSEESAGDTPWDDGFLGDSVILSVGAGSIGGTGNIRYRETGLTCLFAARFGITSLSGASGVFRVGNIPLPLRGGGKFAANAVHVTGFALNRMLSAAVVDVGGGEVAIDLYRYDGSFAGVDDETYAVSGFYEIEPD